MRMRRRWRIGRIVEMDGGVGVVMLKSEIISSH